MRSKLWYIAHIAYANTDRLKDYCEEVGFYKAKEIAFPHKQSNLMKITRDAWEKPCI